MRFFQYLIGFFAIIFLASFVNAVCTDSDSGFQFDVAGTITYGNDFTLADTCEGIILQERFCDSAGNPGTYRYNCTAGCAEGACLLPPVGNSSNQTEPPLPSWNATCVDSDNGFIPGMTGSVRTIFSDNTYTDFCLAYSPRTLIEYSCIGGQSTAQRAVCENGCFNGHCVSSDEVCTDGWYCYNDYSRAHVSTNCLWSNFSRCTLGQICSQGACVTGTLTTTLPAVQCSDSDGGVQYEQRGTIFINNRAYVEDSCVGTGNVVEWECASSETKGAASYTSQVHACESGYCDAGACVPPSSGFTGNAVREPATAAKKVNIFQRTLRAFFPNLK